ncbi:hypothetical protein WA026_005944 [Henosepilachna vigintioctopunctata]|uniref:Uncharacterized protein n=1 Tax=Henosepilachna vigintioctopunctata TaxID=420089 RepID=A0AAW1TY06_9CUCU
MQGALKGPQGVCSDEATHFGNFCNSSHFNIHIISGRIAFEKITEYDYRGSTYYTVKNLSLYECQGGAEKNRIVRRLHLASC